MKRDDFKLSSFKTLALISISTLFNLSSEISSEKLKLVAGVSLNALMFDRKIFSSSSNLLNAESLSTRLVGHVYELSK